MLSRTIRALSIILWAATAGCAIVPELPPLTCPELGGPRWSELKTAHLDLRTDVALAEAQSIAPELERDYQLIERLMTSEVPGATPPADRLEVVLFRDERDVQALAPNAAGFFHENEEAWNPDPAVILEAGERAELSRLFRHELTHRFVAHDLPTAPAWLNEGLAQLFSTAARDGAQIVVGRYHQDLHYYGYQPNVREVFAADEAIFPRESSYYTEAWALVHMLQSTRSDYRARFLAYLGRLADGERGDLAWRDSFSGVDLDALERTLNRYHVILRYDTRTVAAAASPAPAPVAARPMSDQEVHLLWVELRPWTRRNRARLEHDLEQARHDPQPRDYAYWRAGVWAAFGLHTEARDLLAIALESAPDDRRLLRASLSVDGPAALGERLAKVARSGLDWEAAAEAFRSERRLPEALALARRSVAAQPGCVICWTDLALLARRANQLDEAVRAMQRAAWLAPDRGDLFEGLHEWMTSAEAAHVPGIAPPVGELVPPLFTRSEGVEVIGRVVEDANGAPVPRAWIHANVGDDRFALVQTDQHGQFRFKARPGWIHLVVLPEGSLLADRRWVQVRPSTAPLDAGTLKLVRGPFPDPMTAIDGIAPVNRGGRAFVREVQAGSAAQKAGIRAGQRILRVNGHDAHDLGPNAINLLLAGPPGTPITVELAAANGGASWTVRFELLPLPEPYHPEPWL